MSDQQDMGALTDSVVEAVQGYVAKRIGEVERKCDERCANLEFEFAKRIAELPAPVNGINGEKGEAGENGRDADPVDMPAILKTIEDTIAARVAEIPKPENGQNGKDGENGKDAEPVDMEEISNKIQNAVNARVALLPIPKDGEPGKDADMPSILSAMSIEVKTSVAAAVADIPLPRDGIDGQDGQDGKDGERGENGRDAAELEILSTVDRDKAYRRGTWASFDGSIWQSNGKGWDCMVAGIGAIGGELDIESRQLSLSFKRGGENDVVNVAVPLLIERGVWRAGEFKAGDVTSYDGSAWVAQCDTSDTPGTSKAWRMMVRKGRDARPFDTAINVNVPKSAEPVRLR